MSEPQPEKSIFLAAIEIQSETDRAAFLERECAGKPALRAEVEALLQAHAKPQPVLDAAPATAPTIDAPLAEHAGAMIGPYKLLEPIGEGGMGAVWMAQQLEPIKRLVAIKLIKAGMDSKQVLARFEAERQALALMDHPNIARVFDAGTTSEPPHPNPLPRSGGEGVNPIEFRNPNGGQEIDSSYSLSHASGERVGVRGPFSGRPYFVMELVKGVPITKYCDEHHLTPRQRLELFIPVCQAIQHAHQKGIIHRDIKPSNVLVAMYDDRPVPKVIDFGVAKATGQQLTEATLHTGFGAVVGTIEYMSPEQASFNQLDVDTRSDIYSLGVLLYELLAGSPPFTKKDLEEAGMLEMLRVIREQEPSKPSTKLSSSDALPSLSANRGTEPSRLTKLVRGELDWIVMKALEKDRSRRYETANGFASDVQRYLADEAVLACPPSAGYRFRKFARRNKRALTTAALLGAMLLVLAGGFGWVASDRATRQARTAVEVQQFLKRADSLYEDNKLPEAMAEVQKARGLLEASGGDDDLRQQVRQWVADLDMAVRLEEIQTREQHDFDDRDRSYADFERAYREHGIDVEALTTAEAAARVSASRIKLDLVLALNVWVAMLRFDTRPQDPARWQRLLAVSRTADPDPWRLRLLDATEAKDLRALRELAATADPRRLRTRSLARLGFSLNQAGDPETAVAFLRKLQREYPGDFSVNSNLAYCLAQLKPPPKAEIIGFRRVILVLRTQSPNARYNLGIALSNNNQLDEAIAEYREAIRLRPDYASAHNSLGYALSANGLLDEAIAEHREAIRLKPDNAYAHNGLGVALGKMGLVDEAIAEYREAIRLKPDNALAHSNLGVALKKKGLVDEVIAEAREAVRLEPNNATWHSYLSRDLKEKGLVDEAIAEAREAVRLAPDSADARDNLGTVLKNLDEAIACYRKAIELDPKHVYAHYNLGTSLSDHGKPDEAIVYLNKAIELDPKHVQAWNNRGMAYQRLEHLDKAIADFVKAIELNSKLALPHCNLGCSLHMQGKLDEAVAAYRKAIEFDPKDPLSYFNLGLALANQKKLDDAIAAYRKAIELDPKFASAHLNLGIALSAQKKLDEAITAYRKAIELDPKYGNAHFNLGIALSDQRKLDEAIACYRKVIELDPKLADAAHYRIGLALNAQGKRDEAIAAYRQALFCNPKHANARVTLGDVLIQKGWELANNPDPKLRDPKRAVEASKEAVELVPQSALAWQYLGWVQYRAGNWKASIEALETSCKLENPGDCCQWIVMALAHGKLANDKELPEQEQIRHKAEARRRYDAAVKQINTWGTGGNSITEATRSFRAEAAELLGVEQAIKSLEKLAAAQPNAWEPRVKLAQAYAKEGMWDKTAAEYTKAIEVKPDAWEPWSGRAFVYFHRKQWDLATADFSRAIDLAPQVHTNWWHRGHIYRHLEQWDKAAADFGTVVDKWPDGSEGWYLRAIAFAQLKQPEKAVADLRQAIAKGFNNLEALKNEPKLAPLRTRGDFGKLLEELERKQKTKSK